jgi:hypothetical protein
MIENGHANEDGITPLSDEELATLGRAAADLLPAVEWVGDELKFMYETGKYLAKIGKDEEAVGAAETFVVDARSFAEVWKLWSEVEGQKYRSVTAVIGGRRVDGWISPERYLLPDTDRDEWPLNNKGLPQDPWQEYAQLVLKQCSDGRLFTWQAQYGSRRGMGDVLDIVAREGKDHPGCSPVVTLGAASNGRNFYSKLTVVGWQPFGEGASPPANAARAERARQDLRRLQAKDAAKDATAPTKAKGKGGDLDDEIPF